MVIINFYVQLFCFIVYFNIILNDFIFRAFEQYEVTCSPNLRDTNSFWNVEDNINSKCKIHINFVNPSVLLRFKERTQGANAVLYERCQIDLFLIGWICFMCLMKTNPNYLVI